MKLKCHARMVWLLCVLSGCLPMVVRAQLTVTRPHYTARMDALGNLTSLNIGGVEILQKPLEFCPGVTWTLTKKVGGEGAAASEVQFLLHSDKGDGQIDYRFEPESLTVTLTQSTGGFQTWILTAAPQVVAVENLQNNTVTGAEAIQYRAHGEIQAAPVIGMMRAQRTRLYLQNGGKALFWHDGWGAPFNLDAIGAFRDYTYRRDLFENKKPMRLHFEIETPSGTPVQAAPAFTPESTVQSNLFTGTQAVRLNLQFTPQTQARLQLSPHWKVAWAARDFYDRPAGTGTMTFDTPAPPTTNSAGKPVTVPLELPRSQVKGKGWFSLVLALTPAGKVSPAVAPSEYRTRFALVEDSPHFPANTLSTHQPTDYEFAAMMGMKCIRESHVMREYFPERDKPNWKALDDMMNSASAQAKQNGITWFFQANERPQWCSDADYEQLAFELVSHCKDRCHTWEIENEPNFRYAPQDYVTKAFLPFAKAAKRADPACTIIGPACVSVPNSIAFLKAIIAADALKYLDGVSTHTYMGPGEPWELFGNPEYLRELRRLAGNRPLWQTEQGYNWGQSSHQDHARYVTRQYLNGYAAGIANEHHYYFYPVHRGFEPWYLVELGNTGNEGMLEPGAVGLRVLHEQIQGCAPGTQEEPSPGVYSLRFIGKNEDVYALWTLDFTENVTLRGRITRLTDFQGNALPFKPGGNAITLPLNGYPVYAHVTGKAKLAVSGLPTGVNFASAAQGAMATASSETREHPAAHANDDRWWGRDSVEGLPTRTYWEASTVGASEQNPVWLQIDLSRPRTLDHARLIVPLPAVDGGTPRDFALQASDDGSHWHTLVQVKDWTSWIDMLTFKPVKTQHVRLLVTRLNDGWHLDGKWMFMVGPEFTRYTSMQCRVLDLQLYGPAEKN